MGVATSIVGQIFRDPTDGDFLDQLPMERRTVGTYELEHTFLKTQIATVPYSHQSSLIHASMKTIFPTSTKPLKPLVSKPLKEDKNCLFFKIAALKRLRLKHWMDWRDVISLRGAKNCIIESLERLRLSGLKKCLYQPQTPSGGAKAVMIERIIKEDNDSVEKFTALERHFLPFRSLIMQEISIQKSRAIENANELVTLVQIYNVLKKGSCASIDISTIYEVGPVFQKQRQWLGT